MRADSIRLSDGSETPRVWLGNGTLEVAFLPELGGKIASLRRTPGREFLSRGSKPYVRRSYGMEYGDTEFDGIDEMFPTLQECKYPAGALKGVKAPDHGEAFRLPWRHSPLPDGSLLMEYESPAFKYLFKRRARLEGPALILDYEVENRLDETFHFIYMLHPLLRGEAGMRFGLAGDDLVQALFSSDSFLGRSGVQRPWRDFKSADGGAFADAVFRPGGGRYYKIAFERRSGSFSVLYKEGAELRFTWPGGTLPYCMIWCSERGVGDLEHVAPEPSSSLCESLEGAYGKGVASSIAPKGSVKWSIRIDCGAADAAQSQTLLP